MDRHKLYGLDHLRAFAIITVFLFHYRILTPGCPGWLQDGIKFGWTGVDLFFVLSGFLIASQLFSRIKKDEAVPFREFYIKRFFRILPAYWVVVGIYFLCPAFREREALPPLWKFLSFTQNYDLDLRNGGTFSHAWSLCVEEHFYLFLPLILAVLLYTGKFKKGYWLLIALFTGSFFIRHYVWTVLYQPMIGTETAGLDWYRYIYYPTHNRIDGLLVGVAIAGMYHFYPRVWRSVSRYGNLFLLAGVAVLTCAYFLCYDEHSYYASVCGFPLVAVGYGLVVICAVSPASILYKTNSGITRFIAAISYSLYLSHKGIIHLTQQFLAGRDINDNVLLVICFIACVVGAFILRIAVEKPFMKQREKFVKS